MGSVSKLVRRNGSLLLVSYDRSRIYTSAPGQPGDPGTLEALLRGLEAPYYGAQRDDVRRLWATLAAKADPAEADARTGLESGA